MAITDLNRKWWTLGTVCFALLMIVLDNTIVNLAIPKILEHFGATISQLEWVNNAYLLTFAVFLITFGRLGDEIGRKKMFMAGLVFFLAGSLLCGLSASVSQLIMFRVLQGLGGAAMMPATLSIISSTFEPKERGTAMGFWGGVAGLGIALGPILGGYITDLGLGHALNTWLHVSQYWRFVFFINVPIGMIAFFAAWTVIRESRDSEKTHHFDILGILLSALSIFCLTFAFIEGDAYGWWHATKAFSLFGQNVHLGSIGAIPIFFALFIMLGAIFILRERHTDVDPLVDTKLFRSRNFSAGNMTVIILAFGMMGSFFLLPLFLQSILGFTAIKTGTVLLPLAIALMISAPIAGKMADKIGGKWLIFSGLLIMAIGTYWLGHFTLATTVRQLLAPFLVIGFGMGIVQAPLTNITLLEIPPDEAGGASGVFTTMRQIGSVMGIAILGAILQTSMSGNIADHVNQISGLPRAAKSAIITLASDQSTLTSQNAQSLLQKSLLKNIAPAGLPASLSAQKPLLARIQVLGGKVVVAIKQGFTDSINHTTRVSSGIAVLGALSALFFTSRRRSGGSAPAEPMV